MRRIPLTATTAALWGGGRLRAHLLRCLNIHSSTTRCQWVLVAVRREHLAPVTCPLPVFTSTWRNEEGTAVTFR
ncbi:hypothetical protein E2C01_049009 [Portunus trituberculatus]|uniref:Uncharacterized protein n=1 Tax=Portunus trituberculatus TaxID=210409 RepID=A0A5B7GC16_PORTR|nr:hypothetical protein [Portunus trituberculatus]